MSPQKLFLFFALPFGLLMAFLAPPFGGGDEQHHFLRTYEVLSGQWLGNSSGPAGIRQFQDEGIKRLFTALDARDYPEASFSALNNIDLRADLPISQNINKMFVGQFPLAHILYLPGMAVSLALELRPLYALYVCRITGMLLSVFLIYSALRIAPVGGYILCVIALFPTSVFYRSFMHTDSLMMGIAFLFFAILTRMMMNTEKTNLKKNIMKLAALASLIAPLKAGYILFPFLSLLIPKNIFGNAKKYWCAQALIILPGLALTAIWLTIVNNVHGDSLTYSTWAGKEVDPAKQIALMLQDPLAYFSVLVNYIFSFSNFMVWIAGIFSEHGWNIIYLPAYCYLPLIIGTVFIFALEPNKLEARLSRISKILIAFIFIGTILIIMTMIYIAFNPVGGNTIASFQGRYFLPLLPLLALYFSRPEKDNSVLVTRIVAATAAFGLCAAAARLAYVYYF